jgi:hypothetical protein
MNIVFLFDGMPSGAFLTAHLNSAVNSVANRAVFNRYPQKYALKTHGDDVASSHEDGFPLEEANQALTREYGWRITDAGKGGTPVPKHLSECQFLKRGFRFTEGRWVAPLDVGSIYRMLTWVHATSAPDAVAKTFDNWEVALRELSLHEEINFVVTQKLVLKALENEVFHRKPIERSYSDVRALVFNSGMKF